MGLETVEIILETEERFGIEIPDKDASRIRTIGEYYELVCRLLGVKPVQGTPKCLNAKAFYRIRRAMTDKLGIDRDKIRPKAALAEILPLKQRRDAWPMLSKETGLWMPELRRHRDIVFAIWWFGIVFYLASTILVLVNVLPIWLALGGVIASIALMIVLTRPLKVYPHGKRMTFRDLASTVYWENYDRYSTVTVDTESETLWRSLTELIAEQLGVDVTKLEPETRFVEDLNCG